MTALAIFAALGPLGGPAAAIAGARARLAGLAQAAGAAVALGCALALLVLLDGQRRWPAGTASCTSTRSAGSS